MSKQIRVAAVQFGSVCNVGENLATCLRMIDRAAEVKPQLMVLPEFCNHLSWYDDADHAWAVAVALDDEFVTAVANKAKQHSCYIDINVSLKREKPAITVTSLLFNPQGELIAQADKQTLMGHENDYFVRAETTTEVITTELGELGIFPCRDGVTFETPRSLALRGAQLYCDSLNSFALDEASLHVPARAPENKVFLVSANKVGPLIPEEQLEMVSAATHIPVKFLMGAGESQIVAPSGEVLAKAPRDEEAFVYADIDISEADNKLRPDGTDLLAARRPELYSAIAEPAKPEGYCFGGASEVQVAIATPQNTAKLYEALDNIDSDIECLVLPELALINVDENNLAKAVEDSTLLIEQIQQQCQGKKLHVCTSVVETTNDGYQHVGVVINNEGVIARQPQLHHVNRLAWSQLGDAVEVIDLPWGKVALLVGDDSIFPEVAKVAALQGVHCLLVPANMQEPWERQYGLLSRAAENRVCVIASDTNQQGFIATLEREFTIMTDWQERVFDGQINHPIVTSQQGLGVTQAAIHPVAASDKMMSANTDLLVGRPWQLSGDIVATN